MAHLITGYAGRAHITAANQASFNAALFGSGEFVLERGEKLRCQVISNNVCRIYDGDVLMQGRHIIVDPGTYFETTHENGTAGYNRIDLIVMTYSKDVSTGVETAEIEVIKGTPSTGTASVPEYETGDILSAGASKNQMPLYKIPFNGITIGTPVQLFGTVSTLETSKKELESYIKEKAEELSELPIVSDLDEMALIQNEGEFVADAKTVGQLNETVKTLNDGGAITGFSVDSGGVYINYINDAGETVKKKLGSAEFELINIDTASGKSGTAYSIDVSGHSRVLVFIAMGTTLSTTAPVTTIEVSGGTVTVLEEWSTNGNQIGTYIALVEPDGDSLSCTISYPASPTFWNYRQTVSIGID